MSVIRLPDPSMFLVDGVHTVEKEALRRESTIFGIAGFG